MNVIPAVLPPCIILPRCMLPGQILYASVLSPLHLLPSITAVRRLYRHLPTRLVSIIRSNYSKQRVAFTHIPLFFLQTLLHTDENLSICYDIIHLNSFIRLRMCKYVLNVFLQTGMKKSRIIISVHTLDLAFFTAVKKQNKQTKYVYVYIYPALSFSMLPPEFKKKRLLIKQKLNFLSCCAQRCVWQGKKNPKKWEQFNTHTTPSLLCSVALTGGKMVGRIKGGHIRAKIEGKTVCSCFRKPSAPVTTDQKTTSQAETGLDSGLPTYIVVIILILLPLFLSSETDPRPLH